MTPPIKNCKWAKYPLGDVTQWLRENPKLYSTVCVTNSSGVKTCLTNGHNGIDIVRPHGEHMFAVEDGTVKEVKLSADGYGKHVRLWNTDKTREWTYGHCSEIYVAKGQEIKAGQFIATMGNTGFVVSGNTPFWGYNPYAGTHLHFGLRIFKRGVCQNYDNGLMGSVDPLPYFLDPNLKSTKVLMLASEKQDKVLWQFGELLAKIGL